MSEGFPFCKNSIGLEIRCVYDDEYAFPRTNIYFCERENVDIVRLNGKPYIRCLSPYIMHKFIAPEIYYSRNGQRINAYEKKSTCEFFDLEKSKIRAFLEYPDWMYKDIETAIKEVQEANEKAEEEFKENMRKIEESRKNSGIINFVKKFQKE